uniref:heterogeneous nuclear ribonucleoprotein L-like n=1 Tax=Myxine glutinosa TaxID=7769 RepID=UPI00358FD985
MSRYYDGHASKRQRTDVEDNDVHAGARDSYEDPHKPSPSSVVHVRALSESAQESDLIDALQHFGPISFVVMMPKKRQALVEFQDIESARSCVTYSSKGSIYVSSQPAYFNFSTSQKISRPISEDGRNTNHILLFTILNPVYPITTDVLYTISNPCGPVQRIVIFHKNGLQAMVEFETVQCAQRAKASLNGADIYSGCCTLKIEYAKPARLNVYKNDEETWDYTNPDLSREDERLRNSRQVPLLGDHPGEYSGGGASYGSYGWGQGHHGYETSGYPQPPPPPGVSYGNGVEGRMAGRPAHFSPPPQSSSKVLMVYGLDPDRINCDRLFNILCLYGNVEKIKFMKSKPGSAMVEMGESFAVDRAIMNLNQAEIFGKKINLCVSKQQAIVPGQSYDLPDNTTSYKDFTDSRHNRFGSPDKAAKNRIQSPTTLLHFYNAPTDITEEIFTQICVEHSVEPPSSFKTFAGKSEKSSSGLVEWQDKNSAMEALALINHYSMKNTNGPYPYTMKLCFSTNQQCWE